MPERIRGKQILQTKNEMWKNGHKTHQHLYEILERVVKPIFGARSKQRDWNKNTGWGDQLLAPIDEHKDKKKEIPEHLSTRDRFDGLMEREWKPGLDVAKKFDMHVLLGGLDFAKSANSG